MQTLQFRKASSLNELLGVQKRTVPMQGQGINANKRVRFQRLHAVCLWFFGLVGALLGYYIVRPIASEPAAWLSSMSFLAVGASCGQLIAGFLDVVVFGSIEDSNVENAIDS